MARPKFNVPPKRLNEEPATERQLGYLHRLTGHDESDFADLGIWQASALIDLALAIRDENEDEDEDMVKPRPKKQVSGRWRYLALLVIFAGAWIYTQSRSDSEKSEPPAPETAALPGTIQHPRHPARPATPLSIPQIPAPATSPSIAPPAKLKLPALPPDFLSAISIASLPAKVKTTGSISLLDAKGTEIEFPEGTIMRVTQRTAGGTLSVLIAGKPYVGNQNRLASKAEIVEE